MTVSPAVIETKMGLKAAQEHPERMKFIKKATPLQRHGKPNDIADAISFLVSHQAQFITGTDILVDGGVLNNVKNYLIQEDYHEDHPRFENQVVVSLE